MAGVWSIAEIVQSIALLGDGDAAAALARACKQIHGFIAGDSSLRQRLYQRRFPAELFDELDWFKHQLGQEGFAAMFDDQASGRHSATASAWMRLYRQRMATISNWKNNRPAWICITDHECYLSDSFC